jgi:hypothetical protein
VAALPCGGKGVQLLLKSCQQDMPEARMRNSAVLSAGEHSKNQQTLDLHVRFPRTIWRNQEDDTMNRRSMLSLAATGLIGRCTAGIAAAQERQRVSFKTGAENAKYTKLGRI